MLINSISKNLIWQALNSKFTQSEYEVLNYFINRSRMKSSFRASYQTIGNQLKYNEKTIRRAVKKLQELGLVRKVRHDFMSICEFFINRKIFKLADYFRYKFPALMKHTKLAARAWYLQNVRPLCSNFINKISYSYSNFNSTSSTSKNTLTGNLKNIKEEKMDISQPKLSKTLQDINKALSLSLLGQLKLLIFSDAVLTHCWKATKSVSNIKDPYSYLMKVCLKHSEQHKINIDWSLFYIMLSRYNLKDNHRYIEPKKIIPSEVKIYAEKDFSHQRKHKDKSAPHPAFAQFLLQLQ